ncbi:hypothetical protein PR202_ga11981 [Eleusine coracana subsp. coracana]|uniref:DC1 domain-containing protein n=1 Tax=Eleusine coracana subsp. coracana TaxID=191504 RepID=A0AAV5CAY2_ELECO|nr:hypothetical protein QOZ80_5AG0396480 [Eleusine coracana subsp. coracana]GJM95269.1 hypothetical protein PR202_ga11981 [Eleusine coracana subsp. coracana]
MRYGEVAHFSHPQHRLRLEHLDTAFRCDGCGEAGIGSRYRCPARGCDHDLHRQCAVVPLSPPPPPLRHPFYPRCAFAFLPRAPGGSGTRYCNACGRDVAGFVYHCRACGFDLHPCCASLPHFLDCTTGSGGGGAKLYLCPTDHSSTKAVPCHRCGHRGRSWSYRSHCGTYSLHVACVVDMIVDSWHDVVGRRKGNGDLYGSGGYVVPVIRGAARSGHVAGKGGGESSSSYSYWGRRRKKKKGKVKRCCEIAGFASQVVISAVLGDPSALIAGVIGSLIAL